MIENIKHWTLQWVYGTLIAATQPITSSWAVLSRRPEVLRPGINYSTAISYYVGAGAAWKF